jgi:hypothetical protein
MRERAVCELNRVRRRGEAGLRTAAARAKGSGSIVSEVESPTGRPGAPARTAATAASHACASRVWAPRASRGCTCTANAPALRTAIASAASSAGDSGTAGCSARVRSPFRQAFSAMRVACRGPSSVEVSRPARFDAGQLRGNASVGCLRLLHRAGARLILERVQPMHRATYRLCCLRLGEVLVNLSVANCLECPSSVLHFVPP